jgi:hypothetical protein
MNRVSGNAFRLSLGALIVLMATAASPGYQTLASNTAKAAGASSGQAIITSRCLDPTVSLSIEETRLSYVLPDNSNPAVLQPTPFAWQMIQGAGFQDFGPSYVNELCRLGDLSAAHDFVMQEGQQLWRKARNRAQQRGQVNGTLPYSDDRSLYWTRLQATAALRQWKPRFALWSGDRYDLITTFDGPHGACSTSTSRPGKMSNASS